MKPKVDLEQNDIHGWRVGDHVITPLGRHATITALRSDGYLDAVYRDAHSPATAEVILQPHDLKRVQ